MAAFIFCFETKAIQMLPLCQANKGKKENNLMDLLNFLYEIGIFLLFYVEKASPSNVNDRKTYLLPGMYDIDSESVHSIASLNDKSKIDKKINFFPDFKHHIF